MTEEFIEDSHQARSSLSRKISITLVTAATITVTAAVISFATQQLVVNRINDLGQNVLNETVIAAQLRGYMSSMTRGLTRYVLGRTDGRAEFSAAYDEALLIVDRAEGDGSLSSAQVPADLRAQLVEYGETANRDIFDYYDPEVKAWAENRAVALARTGDELEDLLDTLKEGEIQDAGSFADFKEVIDDDLPGVRYYLEILDEAGDMASDIARYTYGERSAANDFVANSQTFEKYFNLLKPLEQKPEEITALNDIWALYITLRDGGYELFARYDPTREIEAVEAIQRLRRETSAQLDVIFDRIVVQSDQVRQTAVTELRNRSTLIGGALILLGIATLTLMIGVIYYAVTRVSRPIVSLATSMSDLARERIDITVPFTDRTDEIGSMARSVLVFQKDARRRIETEKELREANTVAESATQAKADFLAAMSHEIRTPLNGVLGMVEILSKTDLNGEQSRMCRTIDRAGRSLLTIVNDILDISKMEAGRLTLDEEAIDVANIIEEAAATVAPLAIEKGLKLTCAISPAIFGVHHGDAARLRQVLLNLVGNAVKFSEAGEVVISAAMIGETPTQSQIQISVKDQGIGIASDQITNLFQNFSQLDTGPARKQGGTGLGLAICKKLVELMGGNIAVESVEGEGSTFKVNVSLARVSQDVSKDFVSLVSGLKVGIDLESKVMSKFVFDLLGYWSALPQFIEGNDNKQYQELDVFITDNKMWCSSSSTGLGTPSILLQTSSYSLSVGGDYGTCMPIDGCPLRRSDLATAIGRSSGRLKDQKSPPAALEPSDAPMKDQKPVTPKGVRLLVVEDNEVNKEVIQRQLNLIGYDCDLASDGREGLKRWRENNYPVILSDCHMPEMDGFQMSREIRSEEQQKGLMQTPIIAITANVMKGEEERCKAAGMNHYLSKPLKLDILKSTLEKFVSVPGKNDNGQQAAEDCFDFENMNQTLGPDKAFHMHIIGRFMKAAEQMVEECTDAINRSDPEAVKAEAHKIKSSSKAIGANTFTELAKQLESLGASGNTDDMPAILNKLVEEQKKLASAYTTLSNTG